MKILVLQDIVRSGGTERQSILLANAFASAGHATTLVTFRPGGALAATVSTQVRHVSLQPFDLHLDWFAPGLIRQVRAAAPDVVLCMGRMANSYGARLQHAFPRVAVIGTMRTGKTLPGLYQRSLHAVRHIVANSRDARDTLVRTYGLPPEKISVIYNSLVFPAPASMFDTAREAHAETSPTVRPNFSRAALDLRTAQGASRDTRVLLNVAMFRPEKNQRALVEVVSELPPTPPWQLWLAGEGPARVACEQRVAELGLGDRVKFLGFHADPSPLYAAADVAVHASTAEALSNFLIEAQAHGLPVVAYEAQGIAECFLPGRTGWAITPGDRVAFRQALQPLLTQHSSALAAAARAFARETFDPKRQTAAYLNLFATLTA